MIVDVVFAHDPETGQAGPREVLATWPHMDTLVEFEVGDGTVTTTEDHEFWKVTDQAWQETQHIDAGDLLLTADGATVEAGTLLWDTAHVAPAFDLTVDEIHTYHVTAGDESVLVHNNDDPCEIHGIFRGATRDVDIDFVVREGDIFVQPDGRRAYVLVNGDGTNSVVVLEGALPDDDLVTVIEALTDGQLEARIADGRFTPLEDF